LVLANLSLVGYINGASLLMMTRVESGGPGELWTLKSD
jgi:hypothetical protein